MITSASYIRLFIFLPLLVVTGCSQPVISDLGNKPIDPQKELKSTTASEIQSYKKAITLIRDNKLDDAKLLLIEFIEDRPSLAGPWANLGLIYIKQNQLDKAEDALNKAIKRNPKQAQALNLLGFIEYKKEHFVEAEKLYLKAVEYNNKYALAHYNLALLYDIYLQDVANAIRHYKYYLKLTGYKDKKTADWLEQLNNSLKKG